jgi:hypothetical protein
MISYYLSRVPGQFNEERIVFSINGAATTEYLSAKA